MAAPLLRLASHPEGGHRLAFERHLHHEREAEYRQQLYDRGEYDPWTQAEPGAAAEAEDDPTLKELAELYTQEKRRMGRAGMAGGWTEKTYKSDGPILKNFALKTGPNLQASRLRASHIRSFVYQDQSPT